MYTFLLYQNSVFLSVTVALHHCYWVNFISFLTFLSCVLHTVQFQADTIQVKYLKPPCHDPFWFDVFYITYTVGSPHSLLLLGITGWSNVIMENYQLSFHLPSDTFSLPESTVFQNERLLCFFNSLYFPGHPSFINHS